MSALSGPSLTVLRGFIAGANAQYRAAGLGKYQMHVARDGSVSTPNRPKHVFKRVQGTGDAAASQAAAGASQAPAPSAGAAPSQEAAETAARARSGAAPKLTALKPTADGFAMTWNAVSGATNYGVWIDGKLIGHVPKPEFAGQLAAGSDGVIQIDAVRKDGTRTEPTTPIRIGKDASGKLAASDPTKPAAAAATAPAAAAT